MNYRASNSRWQRLTSNREWTCAWWCARPEKDNFAQCREGPWAEADYTSPVGSVNLHKPVDPCPPRQRHRSTDGQQKSRSVFSVEAAFRSWVDNQKSATSLAAHPVPRHPSRPCHRKFPHQAPCIKSAWRQHSNLHWESSWQIRGR